MGGFRKESNLFCLGTDLAYRQMVTRVVSLKMYLCRADKILNHNDKTEWVGVSLCSSKITNASCEIRANT